MFARIFRVASRPPVPAASLRAMATQAHNEDPDIYDVVIVGGGMVGAALGALLGEELWGHGCMACRSTHCCQRPHDDAHLTPAALCAW